MKLFLLVGVFLASTSSFANPPDIRDFCCQGNLSNTSGLWCIVTGYGADVINNYYGGNYYSAGMMKDGSHCSAEDMCRGGYESVACAQ